jgi:hypothetical protein
MSHEDDLSPNPYLERDKKKYPMMSNLNFDVRLLGTKPVLCPMLPSNSSQRMAMFSHNISGAPIPHHPEFPAVASGFEHKFMEYTFNTSRFVADGTILAIVSKYQVGQGLYPITFNPMNYVIYLNHEDQTVDYVTTEQYTRCTNGFGYKNIIDERLLRPGTRVEAGQTLTHSPAVQGEKYCLGTNLNVAYMSSIYTTEDAMGMSRSTAKRLGTTGVKMIPIDIQRNYVPLNLYGTPEEYKFIPDMYGQVREDGILCGFREVDPNTLFLDMNPESLMSPQYHTDYLYYAPPGATIVDIDMYKNPISKVKTPEHIFAQVDAYIQNSLIGYKQLMKVYYEHCVQKGHRPSSAFNTLITNTEMILHANGVRSKNLKSIPKYAYKGEAINFIRMNLTYTHTIEVNCGAKTTDRQGAKGVSSIIIDDEHMPVNEYGVRADIVICPMTPTNRMNFGQLYEQFIGILQYAVIRECKQYYKTDPLRAYDKILEFFYDVNTEYGKLCEQAHRTDKSKISLVDELIGLGYLPVVCPPGLSNIGPDWVLEMRDKYNAFPTPVSYNQTDAEGNVIRRVTTIRPIYIGPVYRYILCKNPHVRASGMSYVNQMSVPITIKRTDVKHQHPIGIVPIRIGEDEVRNLIMTVGPMAYRIISLYANAPAATRIMGRQLLTAKKPSNIKWINVSEQELNSMNVMTQVTKHMLATCGIDAENVVVDKESMKKWLALRRASRK